MRSSNDRFGALRRQIGNFVLVFAPLAHTTTFARIVSFIRRGAGLFDVGSELWYLFLHLRDLESNLVAGELARLSEG